METNTVFIDFAYYSFLLLLCAACIATAGNCYLIFGSPTLKARAHYQKLTVLYGVCSILLLVLVLAFKKYCYGI